MPITKLIGAAAGILLLFSACTVDEADPIQQLREPHMLPLGSAAIDLLTDTKYRSLTVEIVAAQDYALSPWAVEKFTSFLTTHLAKPDGIFIEQRVLNVAHSGSLTIAEVLEQERQTRSLYSKEDHITVYIFVADGTFHLDNDTHKTLGSAYHNTSMVIYGKTLRALSQRPDMPLLSVLEATTLTHEFGHLLGLSDDNRHAKDHSDGHCNEEGCLMEAAIRFDSGLSIIDKNIPDLGPKCLLELNAKKNQ
ncbi:hypothetical protein [Aquimarina brevivitae]|uniref:Membrane metalloprotease n=1 Tax=Aquimarina brevivitae TaxID=323412 RepID=A0A4Q7P059_9FLAO|nr:hypothetical protein [Aquimarina brevivitae]RZS93065.1 hypothetical protein EV197_1629 [Aquimarina brevivitae]